MSNGGDDEWPDNVAPLTPAMAVGAAERPEPASVFRLPSSEPTVEWQGDEDWVSTLPDPRDTTQPEQPE